jgi:hypothetical protein
MEDNRSFVSAQKGHNDGDNDGCRGINSEGESILEILSQQTVVKGPVRAIPVSIA